MNNLVLGDGLLGTEIVKQTGWDYISRKKHPDMDFNDIYSYAHRMYNYDTIINCIAYTNTYSNEKQIHWETNFLSVCDLVDHCNKRDKTLVHISTDFVYSNSKKNATEQDVPVHCNNWYGYTKLLSDGYVLARCLDYLLIRTSFKPRPFPYPKALINQMGNFEYVDNVASKIIELVNNHARGLYNVGHETCWSIYDMAIETNSKVEKLNTLLAESMPTDITMDTSKMKEFLNET